MFRVSGRRTSHPEAGPRPARRMAVPLLLCLAAPVAWAASDAIIDTTISTGIAQADLAMTADPLRRLQIELSGTSLPRFDSTDGSTRASRIAITLLPPRRSALGLSVGVTNPHGPMLSAPFANGSPRMDLGLHWRFAPDDNYRVDITAWRRMAQPDALTLVQNQEPTYGARIEMGLGQAYRTGFVAQRGFLGFQLESGARITLRRSGGKPMVYYRTRF